MKTFELFFVSIIFLFFISLCPIYSQTIIPGGYVSGTWTVANSPFQINGDITVHTDSTLTIEPGVEVIFQGHYKFIINGLFNAVGAESDSIHFYAADTSVGWWGLRFMNSSIDTNYLAYCIFENGKATAGSSLYDRRGGGVYCQNSYISVKHCTFRNNYAEYQGGGLCINGFLLTELTNNIFQDNTCEFGFGGGAYIDSYDSLKLRHNLFIRNYSRQEGGGLHVYHHGTGTINYIQFCEFEENTSDRGGGIYWLHTDGTMLFYLEDCIFRNNNATYKGAGLWLQTDYTFINRCNFIGNRVIDMEGKGGGVYFTSNYGHGNSWNNCVFAKNRAFEGGGIYFNDAKYIFIENNTFFGNYSDEGSCVFVDSTSLGTTNYGISNSIFAFNPVASNHGAIYVEGEFSAIEYSDFLGNGSNIYGNAPAGFGLIDSVNANGDSCDVYSNLFLDPFFADTANGDFHLTWSNWPTPDSTKSPCIDAGDPTSPFDPDGTITDMGAFSFDQSVPVELVSFSAEVIEGNVTLKWITATETNNSGFEIQRKFNNTDWEKIGFVEGHGTTTEINKYSYTDNLNGINGNSITYRLKQIDFDGSYEYSNEVLVGKILPVKFALEQNYPNPFNPSTKIKYSIPQSSNVILKVFDILGNEIETLVKEEKPTGTYELNWNAANLPSGVYFYQLRAGSFVEIKKMLLLK